tara:strand:+ start:10008 stop:10403 length:396 start_codon:yes stop_codon:yes gene_type:complete
MKYIDLLRELNRLTTTMLLAEKVVCTVKISVYRLIELALLGITGGFAGLVMPKLFDGSMIWDTQAMIFGCIAVYTGIMAVIARFNHGHQLGKKELIIDLLAYRMNRTGKSVSSKRQRRKANSSVDNQTKPE